MAGPSDTLGSPWPALPMHPRTRDTYQGHVPGTRTRDMYQGHVPGTLPIIFSSNEIEPQNSPTETGGGVDAVRLGDELQDGAEAPGGVGQVLRVGAMIRGTLNG
jgi:hypothetical protein